jgi:DNA-nicking Smr family endonuclease
MNDPSPGEDEVHPLPITSELDLHTFRPQDLNDVVPEYLRECQARGILEVRVIHGKGRGQVMRSVHAILSRMPEVISFALASPAYGGSGATFVRLRPSAPTETETPG